MYMYIYIYINTIYAYLLRVDGHATDVRWAALDFADAALAHLQQSLIIIIDVLSTYIHIHVHT